MKDDLPGASRGRREHGLSVMDRHGITSHRDLAFSNLTCIRIVNRNRG